MSNIDEQLREMFAIHKDLFDAQEREAKERAQKRTTKQYERFGKYTANLNRNRVRRDK